MTGLLLACFVGNLTLMFCALLQKDLFLGNVLTFGGAKRSGSDRECKCFPIGMNAREPLWR